MKPNFLIVGAAKSGTTALYKYLKEHPEIFMSSIKETHFFAKKYKNLPFEGPYDDGFGSNTLQDLSLKEYYKLFDNASKYKMVGEVSPDYLYYNDCAQDIKKHLGDIKIIIILRNPIERAFSAYSHLLRDGKEDLSFKQGLKKENYRMKKNWDYIYHYKNVGLYFEQVKKYLEEFSDVKVILYNDFKSNNSQIVKGIYQF